jgi:chromosome segregation ATPase
MWPWLFTAAGKRLLLAAAALAVLGGGFLTLRSHYIALGKQEDAAAALDASAKQLADQQKEFQSRYAALESERVAEAARSQALLVTTSKLAADISALESERARDRATVTSLPEPSLVPDLRRKLNVAPASTAPDLLPPELRAADTIVTDYPAVTAENRDLTASNQTLTSRAASLSSEINSVTAERDLSFDWGDAVFNQYRDCFNSFPRHRGFFAHLCHVATFGLGCKPKKLALPPPSSLAQQRPPKSSG